jgi:Domain of unknown function (DUF4266)
MKTPISDLFSVRIFTMSKRKCCAAFVLISLLSGCASLGVKPWERNLLAKKSMQLTAYPLEAAADDHTYFSKEASAGGRGFGGGGCGCN